MKIFLDTTHLLPFFGIHATIPQHVEQLHLLLKKPKPIGHILISDLSLIEIRGLLNSCTIEDISLAIKRGNKY